MNGTTRSGRGVTWEHSFPGVSFRGKALPILLAVVSLSTVTWVLRLAQLSDLSRGSSTSTSLQTSQDKQPVDQQGSMQYLRKVGELFRAETPPVVSEGNVQTAYVTRQSPDADKQPGATRFVCLSDTHGLHSESSSNAHLLQVPQGDVLVFGGDAGIAADRHVKPFSKWLESQPHSRKVITFGNMDHWVERAANKAPQAFPAADAVFLGGMYSSQATIEVQQGATDDATASTAAGTHKFRVSGSPFTPKYYGSFQLQNDKDAEIHWSSVLPTDEPLDILVTHGPPKGSGDLTRGHHVGDEKLLEAVQKLKTPPVLWLVGHIHNAYGTYKILHESTNTEIVVANVASNDLRSGKDTPPMVFDVKPRIKDP